MLTGSRVYQEVVVARRVDMIWGDILLPLDFITGLIVSVYGIAKSAEDGRWHRRIKKASGFSPVRTIYHDRKAHREGKLNLLNVLSYARKHLNATDDRDYVFAFLAINKNLASTDKAKLQDQNGVPSLHDLVLPNYLDSVEDVYTNFARAAVQSSSSLEILQYVVPTKLSTEQKYTHPSWVPNWANRNFVCGSPIFVAGVPNHLSTCRGNLHPQASSMHSNINPKELHVFGHRIDCIGKVLKHSFKHAYFIPTLKKAFGLEELLSLLRSSLEQMAQDKGAELPEWFVRNARETLLRTVLADGAFTVDHKLHYPIEKLQLAYQNAGSGLVVEENEEEIRLRQYLRQTGEVASGKRVFLMGGLDIGLAFSTVRDGDIVCILYGCDFPCVLRRCTSDGSSRNSYSFVGLCFLNGWMDGARNSRDWDWWREDPEEFILV